MAQAIESASKTKPRFCFATMKNSMDGVFQSIPSTAEYSGRVTHAGLSAEVESGEGGAARELDAPAYGKHDRIDVHHHPAA